METNTGAIYAKMSAIMADVKPIAKDQQAKQYKFRGVDQIYNELHSILAKHGVFTTSEVKDIKHDHVTAKNQYGKEQTITRCIATIAFTFWAEDGSSVTSEATGEQLDFHDRATAGAFSDADKTALLKVFKIPTDEQKDAELNPIDVPAQDHPAWTKLLNNAKDGVEHLKNTWTNLKDSERKWVTGHKAREWAELKESVRAAEAV